MEGKLYTAQEIFDALQEATERQYDNDDVEVSLLIARIGSNIAYEVMKILKFDEQKTIEYCKKKIEKEEGKEKAHKDEEFEEAIDEKPMVKHKYELHVICPHCEKECRVPICVTTDDKNVNDAFSLLCSFGARGRKEER